MNRGKLAKYFLIGLFLVFLVFSVLIVKSILKDIVLALILSFAFYPVYSFIKKYLKNESLSSWIMIIVLLLLIIIPGALIITSLVNQAQFASIASSNYDFTVLNNKLGFLGEDFSMNEILNDVSSNIGEFIIGGAPGFIGSLASTFVGLFIMFFVMFYAFRDGLKWLEKIESNLPLKKQYIEHLFKNTKNIISAVIYGYILTAIAQGIIGGFIFFILDIPNPIFWGFMMIIFAAVPFIGTPIIWLPAAIIEIISGNYATGIILLVLGVVVISNIDNILRPKLIGNKAKVHPVVILVGVIGGLTFFGFMGIILGPLILSLLIVLTKFFLIEMRG